MVECDEMSDGAAQRKRKRMEGASGGLLSTYTAQPNRARYTGSAEVSSSTSSALQQINKSYSDAEDLFPFYNKSTAPDPKPEVRRVSPKPRDPLPRSSPSCQNSDIPFLKSGDPRPPKGKEGGSGRPSTPATQQAGSREAAAKKHTINKPVDGAPTRRPKVPKGELSAGSTADNPMSIDSSDEEPEVSGEDTHQWCISAAHVGSLTKLDVTILEINTDHFEFNITSNVLLAEVKVCVPWSMIIKIETHFSKDLHCMVIHVESSWASGLIDQLKGALARQIPLELEPSCAIKFRRVISLEFLKEPPRSHLMMMNYYLDKSHNIKLNRIEQCSATYIRDFLPPIDHLDTHHDMDVIEQDTRTLLVYPAPPAQASITLTYADLECLKPEEFLNDSILDFYLKYIHLELMPAEMRNKTHLFNSFFYKALTQPMKKEPRREPTVPRKLSVSERMHAQVKNWSKSIDLFSKDFIIVPINEHQHWYLAIICYPWLEGPVYLEGEFRDKPDSNTREETTIDEKDIDGVLSKYRERSTVPAISCRPCILMFDSLVANGRSKVVNNLRNYLAVEWKTKGTKPPRNFTKFNYPGIFVEGPLQENFCDCGVFLLHFVEKFFENPITDFRFPVERKDWFSQQDITKKRDYLRKLIVRLGPNRQFNR